MTSSDSQVNGNGVVATVPVVGFIVAVMAANFFIDSLAWAWGRF